MTKNGIETKIKKKFFCNTIGSDVPVLSSLVIQDEYSMPLDGHYPTFELCHVDNQKLWSQQIEQLFVFKMSEVMRVLFMMQLLLTGPEVEQGFTYSEVRDCVYCMYLRATIICGYKF